MRTTVLEVDIDKFNMNINNIQKYVGDKKIMPVLKANAYGTYINKRIETVNQFDIIAVAIVDEAIEFRKQGYNKEILILNQPYFEEIEDIIKYNITIGLSEDGFLDKLNKIDKKIKVHLEIETGMNRTGIKLNRLSNFLKKVKENHNIIVEGIYTHLSSADYDKEYTKEQLNKFKEAVSLVKNEFDTIKYIHSSASNGLINYDDSVSNLVRPGIIMYGYESFDGLKEKIDIYPICKLKTKITFLKEIDQGESVSYSRKFISNNKMKIATIPLGYADGLRRELSNKDEVVVNNKKAKIIGNVCMDSCMIDVTNIKDVQVGTNVYIWDNEHITLEDVADRCNTINYEILSTISYRVPRVFIEKKI